VATVEEILSQSGFPLQLALEMAVRDAGSGVDRDEAWHVLSREQPWRDREDDRFIDLVIGREGELGARGDDPPPGGWLAAIECKRAPGGTWYFLAPTGDSRPADERLTAAWAVVVQGRASFGFADVPFDPSGPQSEFCKICSDEFNRDPRLRHATGMSAKTSSCMLYRARSRWWRTTDATSWNRVTPPVGRPEYRMRIM
jgi:hypothetical protein